MLTLGITSGRSPLRLLLLGAHADDIEIGAGGTVRRLIEEQPQVEVRWVVFSGEGERRAEAEASAAAFLEGVCEPKVSVEEFPDGRLPFHGEAVKQTFEEIKSAYSPDLILTHYRHDLHQDHRLISELTWNTFRNHLILEYEIPKYDGDMGRPGVFVPLSADICEKKIDIILDVFQS